MVNHHQEPNVYYIQLLNAGKKDSPKVVNRCQLFNLQRSTPPSASPVTLDGHATIPSFLQTNKPSVHLDSPSGRTSPSASNLHNSHFDKSATSADLHDSDDFGKAATADLHDFHNSHSFDDSFNIVNLSGQGP